MRNPVIAVVALALLACLAPATGRASLSMYSRDFETYSAPSAGCLLGDGWLVYGNVYTPSMTYLYGYGAYPVPNDGAAFCAIVSG